MYEVSERASAAAASLALASLARKKILACARSTAACALVGSPCTTASAALARTVSTSQPGSFARTAATTFFKPFGTVHCENASDTATSSSSSLGLR